jgi:hypothetical protein
VTMSIDEVMHFAQPAMSDFCWAESNQEKSNQEKIIAGELEEWSDSIFIVCEMMATVYFVAKKMMMTMYKLA